MKTLSNIIKVIDLMTFTVTFQLKKLVLEFVAAGKHIRFFI